MTEKTKLYDYFDALLAIMQEDQEQLEKKRDQIRNLKEKFSFLEEAKSITISSIPNEIGNIADSIDIALLHNKNVQRRVADAMEMVKKAEK